MRQLLKFVASDKLLAFPLDISKFRMCQNNHLVINDLCAKFDVNRPVMNLAFSETMPCEHKGCPLKRPLSGRVFHSFQIHVLKGTNTNGQKTALRGRVAPYRG